MSWWIKERVFELSPRSIGSGRLLAAGATVTVVVVASGPMMLVGGEAISGQGTWIRSKIALIPAT